MTECDSKELLIPKDGKGINFQSLEISRPVPPPLPVKRGEWENEKLLESAAGVAVSSGLIQVSVRAMRFSLECNRSNKICFVYSKLAIPETNRKRK